MTDMWAIVLVVGLLSPLFALAIAPTIYMPIIDRRHAREQADAEALLEKIRALTPLDRQFLEANGADLKAMESSAKHIVMTDYIWR